MTALRRTKIVATLGPASRSAGALRQMISAGLDVVRLNFSHGRAEDHAAVAHLVKEEAKKLNKEVAILADLQGPKIRIGQFQNDKIQLQIGDEFILDAELASSQGDQRRVGIDYKNLPDDVLTDDILLLDDGRIVLRVLRVLEAKIICTVEVGGELSNNKGINRKGGGLSVNALTEKDKADLVTAAGLGVDYLAISFPRSAKDVSEAKELLQHAGSQAGVIAKIERIEAVDNIDEILQEAAGVMVARGDLGVEIGDAELPGVQKRIIHRARAMQKVTITATQMMESMIHNQIPTRAEVFDVANAVLDGTDAVMLSAETAVGDHPALVIEAVNRVCLGAERQPRAQLSKHRIDSRFERIDEAIAMATMYTANHLDLKAILSLTESGSTPLWMSRIRSGIPIYALCGQAETRRRMSLYRGVYPVHFDITQCTRDDINQKALDVLKQNKTLAAGDTVILTKGDMIGVHGGTNSMKIMVIE